MIDGCSLECRVKEGRSIRIGQVTQIDARRHGSLLMTQKAEQGPNDVRSIQPGLSARMVDSGHWEK